MKNLTICCHDFGETILTEEVGRYIGRGRADWLSLVNNKRLRRAEVRLMHRRLEDVETAVKVLAAIAWERGEDFPRFPPDNLGGGE